MSKFRIEKDSLGEIRVQANKYWGAQTQRSLKNFPIGNDKMPFSVIKAFAIQKKAAAISNIAIEKLSKRIGEKIIDVCDQIIDEKLNDHFPLSVWQTGSGTQTNMNLNEVIANKANEELGKKLGSYSPVHPNDHCNLGQSSNDSFPSVMHIAVVIEVQKKLRPTIENFIHTLNDKKKEFLSVVKVGRTHLQDATPITLGQEFGSFKSQMENALLRILKSLDELYFLAQGGTAVGTGLNSSKKFISGFLKALEVITGYTFKESRNKFESLACHNSILMLSGAINTLTTASYKIANDIRLLASGPRCGIGEIMLPENEPGSSIMPGKVNPTQCEALSQVCIHLMGLHYSISIAASQGHFQLNANKTMIVFSILRSINLISDALDSFNSRCLTEIKANKEKINDYLEKSLMLVTALNPKIGYDKSAQIAKKAFNENITLKQSAVELKYLTEEEFDEAIQPERMTKIS